MSIALALLLLHVYKSSSGSMSVVHCHCDVSEVDFHVGSQQGHIRSKGIGKLSEWNKRKDHRVTLLRRKLRDRQRIATKRHCKDKGHVVVRSGQDCCHLIPKR